MLNAMCAKLQRSLDKATMVVFYWNKWHAAVRESVDLSLLLYAKLGCSLIAGSVLSSLRASVHF